MRIALLAVIGLGAVVLPLFLIVWASRRVRGLADQVRGSVLRKGDHLMAGPVVAQYEGTSKVFGRCRTTGVLALTSKGLLFQPVFGKSIQIPEGRISAVPQESRSGRWTWPVRDHLAIVLENGEWLEFSMKDAGLFRTALEKRSVS